MDIWVPLKEKEKKIKLKVEGETDGVREHGGERERIFKFFFSLFISFSDLRKSDRRISSG